MIIVDWIRTFFVSFEVYYRPAIALELLFFGISFEKLAERSVDTSEKCADPLDSVEYSSKTQSPLSSNF